MVETGDHQRVCESRMFLLGCLAEPFMPSLAV
jgi:hypothetical protein